MRRIRKFLIKIPAAADSEDQAMIFSTGPRSNVVDLKSLVGHISRISEDRGVPFHGIRVATKKGNSKRGIKYWIGQENLAGWGTGWGPLQGGEVLEVNQAMDDTPAIEWNSASWTYARFPPC